jgi:hypothetical protein
MSATRSLDFKAACAVRAGDQLVLTSKYGTRFIFAVLETEEVGNRVYIRMARETTYGVMVLEREFYAFAQVWVVQPPMWEQPAPQAQPANVIAVSNATWARYPLALALVA